MENCAFTPMLAHLVDEGATVNQKSRGQGIVTKVTSRTMTIVFPKSTVKYTFCKGTKLIELDGTAIAH